MSPPLPPLLRAATVVTPRVVPAWAAEPHYSPVLGASPVDAPHSVAAPLPLQGWLAMDRGDEVP